MKQKQKTPGAIMAQLLAKKAKTGKTDARLKEQFKQSTVVFFESRGCHVKFK